jgi:succinyl-CoA synthetase alpha subunit
VSILIDENTRLLVQGITGRDGSFHTKQMVEYGTKVVGGVTPGKGGQTFEGVPVFNNMDEAVKKTGANATVIYVPAAFAADAMLEAVESGVKLIVCITEGVPVNDTLKVYNYIQGKDVRLIGPNCPGLLSPGKSKIGIMPGHITQKGKVGVVSKSGTLTYEVVYAITRIGLGQTTCIGIGGDPIIGTNFIDVLDLFNKDPETEAIAMIGEIGGTDEEQAAEFIKANIKKPMASFIAGRTAPEGKRMGHAGAIISGGMGTSESKIKALNAAGVPVCDTPSDIANVLAEKLK